MSNFGGNMPRHYAPGSNRGGRMPYMPPGMMPGQMMRNNNGNRRSGGNTPPQSLLGGYRPPMNNFRGRGGLLSNPAYVHNVADVLNLLQQQKQKPNGAKYTNPNNPNNRFYQQFQDNYKKISSGQKVSNLYQASFPVQHIPREMRFNFRLLGRNIFTASDEEEEAKEKEKEKNASNSDKRTKSRRSSSSSSDSRSDDDRRKRRSDDDDNSDDDKPSSKSHHEQKRSTKVNNNNNNNSNNRNRTSSSTAHHPKNLPAPHDLLADPASLSTLLAGIIQGENPEVIASTLATAAAVNSKRERTKKQQERKVQKFKNYARFQQIQATAGGVVPATNPDEVEKKIHGLARRLVSS